MAKKKGKKKKIERKREKERDRRIERRRKKAETHGWTAEPTLDATGRSMNEGIRSRVSLPPRRERLGVAGG